MQGILIDPRAKTVTTCEVDGKNTLQSLYDLMRCAYVQQLRFGKKEVLVVDEGGKLTYPNKDGYFLFRGNIDMLVAGCAVVLAIENDEWISTTKSVKETQAQVEWATPTEEMAKPRAFIFSW